MPLPTCYPIRPTDGVPRGCSEVHENPDLFFGRALFVVCKLCGDPVSSKHLQTQRHRHLLNLLDAASDREKARWLYERNKKYDLPQYSDNEDFLRRLKLCGQNRRTHVQKAEERVSSVGTATTASTVPLAAAKTPATGSNLNQSLVTSSAASTDPPTAEAAATELLTASMSPTDSCERPQATRKKKRIID